MPLVLAAIPGVGWGYVGDILVFGWGAGGLCGGCGLASGHESKESWAGLWAGFRAGGAGGGGGAGWGSGLASGRRGAVRCGVVCERRCYQMAMAGMPCIWVMQNGRAVCLNGHCVLCVAHLWWAGRLCWVWCGVVWCGVVWCGRGSHWKCRVHAKWQPVVLSSPP